MSDTVDLKTGKTLKCPALFPNPQSKIDARTLKETHARYGLEYANGVVINLEDWSELNGILFDRTIQSRLSDQPESDNELNGNSVNSQPLVIYPDMSPLLGRSYGGEEEAILSLELDDGTPVIPQRVDVAGILEQLSKASDEDQQRLRNEVLTPLLEQRETVQNILEFQVQQGADIVLSPSVPINSMRDFDARLQTIEEIHRISSAVVEGSLLSEDVDLMHVASIRPSVLRNQKMATRQERKIYCQSWKNSTHG